MKYKVGDIVLVNTFGYDEPRVGIILETRNIAYSFRKDGKFDIVDYLVMIQNEAGHWYLEDDIVKKIKTK